MLRFARSIWWALFRCQRIRRLLQDDLTFEDPKAYTKPWTGQKIFKLRPTWSLEEWACEDSRFFDDYMKKTVAGASK